MRVVVTRPRGEAGSWLDALRAHGHEALALPLIEITYVDDRARVEQAWSALRGCRAAMFVSANAVRAFFDGAVRTWPNSVRAWATGPGTRAALLGAGLAGSEVDSPGGDAAQFDSETLWAQVAAQVRPGDTVLIVRGGNATTGHASGRDWLALQLESAGARVETCVAYGRGVPRWDDAERASAVALSRDAAWLFSSSEAIANLRALLPGQSWSDATAIATHPRIAQAALDAGFGVVCPSRPALDDVIAALESRR